MDKEFDKFIAFINAACEVCKEPGVVYEFECPICGGTAKASKSSYNGHHRAVCADCEMSFIE